MSRNASSPTLGIMSLLSPFSYQSFSAVEHEAIGVGVLAFLGSFIGLGGPLSNSCWTGGVSRLEGVLKNVK